MGVAGLWPLLDSSSKTISLAALSLTGFTNPHRGYRLGIDASIWFFHADYGKEGENPQLRTLFFRCATLLKYPILPLFIFDGPKRPDWKRGKKINKTANKLTTGMKAIIEAFGFEWRTAPGEAEAELAYLNATGVIDGVLSDDVDTFVFGARTVVRNPSSTHSSDEKRTHVRVCTNIEPSRADLILIALCSGGDYCEAGLPSCGIKTAYALARAGLSTSLYKAATTLPRPELPAFLTTWRTELKEELRTDSHRCIGRKMVLLAKSVPESFPNIDVLLAYTHPVTSRSEGKPDYYVDISWTRKEPQIPALAGLCEFYFDDSGTLIWPGHCSPCTLRRYILDDDPEQVFTLFSGDQPVPGDGWMKKIHSKREHHSTDKTLEYRVEVDPTALVALAEAGVKEWEVSGDEQDDEDSKKKGSVDPLEPLRLWLPAVLVRQAKPELVKAYEGVLRKKQEKKTPKGRKKKGEELSGDEKSKSKPRIKKNASTGKGQDLRSFFPSQKSSTATALKDSPIANAASATITPSLPSTSTKVTVSRQPRPFPASFSDTDDEDDMATTGKSDVIEISSSSEEEDVKAEIKQKAVPPAHTHPLLAARARARR
ncbi:PIN domain-like protein [Desarmillaria tabescens]|uniref:PIN domain-like protein n=1 Tax=Armillaria tabescens TaxID=1929756 RepID=A0AA39U638_ARMTA|nr:PIN domain-like protein [Desarmillaria tabescens]KAK0467730.1 PIN domain-like protein [Desarmillaria tabescens]